MAHMRARANLTEADAETILAFMQATNIPEGGSPTVGSAAGSDVREGGSADATSAGDRVPDTTATYGSPERAPHATSGDTTMRHANRLAAAVAASSLVVAGSAAARATPPRPTSLAGAAAADTAVQVSDSMIAAGRTIYHTAGTCLACHGDKLQGTPVGPNLKNDKWKDGDGSFAAILEVLQKGVSGTAMRGHPGGISDEQARDVAAYVWAVSQGKVKP